MFTIHFYSDCHLFVFRPFTFTLLYYNSCSLFLTVVNLYFFFLFRDNLFRLSLRSLKLLERAKWEAPAGTISLCQDKGQSEENCHNYIKVLLNEGRKLFTCGTYAFSPKCSWREVSYRLFKTIPQFITIVYDVIFDIVSEKKNTKRIEQAFETPPIRFA